MKKKKALETEKLQNFKKRNKIQGSRTGLLKENLTINVFKENSKNDLDYENSSGEYDSNESYNQKAKTDKDSLKKRGSFKSQLPDSNTKKKTVTISQF